MYFPFSLSLAPPNTSKNTQFGPSSSSVKTDKSVYRVDYRSLRPFTSTQHTGPLFSLPYRISGLGQLILRVYRGILEGRWRVVHEGSLKFNSTREKVEDFSFLKDWLDGSLIRKGSVGSYHGLLRTILFLYSSSTGRNFWTTSRDRGRLEESVPVPWEEVVRSRRRWEVTLEKQGQQGFLVYQTSRCRCLTHEWVETECVWRGRRTSRVGAKRANYSRSVGSSKWKRHT